MFLLFPNSSLFQSSTQGRSCKNTDWFLAATFREKKKIRSEQRQWIFKIKFPLSNSAFWTLRTYGQNACPLGQLKSALRIQLSPHDMK